MRVESVFQFISENIWEQAERILYCMPLIQVSHSSQSLGVLCIGVEGTADNMPEKAEIFFDKGGL